MTELRASVAAAREHLMEGLCAAGFTILDDMTLEGNIEIDGIPVQHLVTISDDFPYAKPKVRTAGGEGGLSWHRESDGNLCLWSDDDGADLPWLEANAVLARIAEWHAKDSAGWPDDLPDLDLQRYWAPASGLIVHGDLRALIGVPCRIKSRGRDVFELQPHPAPRRSRSGLAAAVVDVGELTHPLHTFEELCDRLDAGVARRLEADTKSGHTRIVMVRYTRGGEAGSLGLLVVGRNPHDIRAADTASSADEVMRLRSGPDADHLAKKRIAILGVGAVGSLMADQLARSGVGALTLLDPDGIRPGNCVRHLVGTNHVGQYKVEAVRDVLGSEPFVLTTVDARIGRLSSVDAIEELFDQHDLVIDATGNAPATALVLRASELLDRPAISVCLQRAGTVVRVDRIPLREGESHAPVVPVEAQSVELREGGCGDPVSPTPPWACAVAAAHATGMAVDLLMGRMAYPATLLEDLAAGRRIVPPVEAAE